MIEEVKNLNTLTLIYFGDTHAKEFTKVYQNLSLHKSVVERFKFYHNNDKDCASTNGITSLPTLVMFRNLYKKPESLFKFIYDGPWETESIVDFMIANSIPNIIDFNEDYIDLIFSE